MHTSRRRARSRTRILYWFRTPPGVRVGRAALDENAIRLIEEYHPDIQFDWAQILRGDQEAPAAAGPAPQAPERTRPEPEVSAEPPAEPVSPAHARLGSEGLARLRGRYAEIMAAIARRVPDPERREELKTEAERLNPDSWVTDDEVRLGLERYEGVLGSFREVLGRRRRRRRTRPAGAASGPVRGENHPPTGAETPGAAQEEDPAEEDDEPGTGSSQN